MRTFGAVCLFFASPLLFGQADNVRRACLLFDKGDALAAQGHPTDALALYGQGLALDPWAFYSAFDAFHWALGIKDTAQAEALLCQGVGHGLNVGLFSDDAQLQAFLERPRAGQFRARLEEGHRAFGSFADSTFIHVLDSLLTEDQRYRNSGGLDTKAMGIVDSLNFEYLIRYFGKHGFPDPHRLGHARGDLDILLWHHRGSEYPGSSQWQCALPYIRHTMAAGGLRPDFLSMFDDYSDKEAGRPMRYGVLLFYYSSYPAELYLVDRSTLNANRAAIGRGPIEEAAIVAGVDLRQVRFAH